MTGFLPAADRSSWAAESMDYVARVPTSPLNAFVDDIYCLKGVPQHRRVNVPPLPSTHLMINLAGPVDLYDSDHPLSPTVLRDGWFMGVWTRRFAIEHGASAHVVGVHFKPWGLAPFVDIPLSEMQNRSVPVEAIWGRAAGRLRERLATACSTEAMLSIMERELRSRLVAAPPSGPRLVDHVARRIATSWGSERVGVLAEEAGVSANQLAAQFKVQVGLTPKRVARIYRFAKVILAVDAQREIDWARLAHDAGYFDQAHFSREFADFTGHTPSSYLALRRRFPAAAGFAPDEGPFPAE